MRFPHNTKIFRGQLDAAPFIGVFFLLVIMMLLASGFVFIPGVRIELPQAADLSGVEGPTVVVAVDAEGHFYFENQFCDETVLKQRLVAAVARSTKPLTLVVQADRRAQVDIVNVRLPTIARAAGIRQLLQAVHRPDVPAPAASAKTPTPVSPP
jgi:biopolymer transport protein ExbD